jgi:predicted ATPase
VCGYKSLADVDVRLHPLTVVFGPNASGKSNLLDLLALVSHMVVEPNLNQAFQRHRGIPLEAFTFDAEGLAGLQKRESQRFWVFLDVKLSDDVVTDVERRVRQARQGLSGSGANQKRLVTERRLRYSLEVEVLTSTGHLRVVNERLEPLTQGWEAKKSKSPYVGLSENEDHLVVRMERQGRPRQEEIGQDRTLVSTSLYEPHHPHIVAFREELSRWRFYFPSPSRMRQEVAVQEVETLAPEGENLAAFFNTLKVRNEGQFRAVAKAVAQVVPTLEDLDVERTAEGLLRLQVYEAGMPLSSRLISEGTLRVLGLLAVTNPLTPLTLVGYEEPENGVHPNRLSMVARFLEEAASRGNTQFILNTHSPVLPEDLQFNEAASLVCCRKSGRSTVFEPFGHRGELGSESAIRAALDEDQTSSLQQRLVQGELG